jgi:hypothetical protein
MNSNNTKLIKVVYYDGKCYQCNGKNISHKDGKSLCIDCSIEVVIFDYITKDEYKHVFCLS